ncbi:hypothetical protein [Streptosporangium sp. OZ121]|uniref:hypothetical protein n=1 Tax=Streptosporangium sp. OZ121 TaxID=3444183 RepID=UPI003F7AAA61
MSRAVFGLFVLLIVVTGCAKAPVADTVVGIEESVAPLLSPHPSGGIVYLDDGTNAMEVCGLVSSERVGDIFGVFGVEAGEITLPDNGNHVGTCDYTTGTFTLRLSLHARDITLTAAEFVKGATYGKGQPIDGLGEAAALVKFDDGVGRLVMVQDELTLVLAGANENADDFAEVAKEALPRLASL